MTDTLKHRESDDEGYLAVNTETMDINLLTGADSKVEYSRIGEYNKNIDLFFWT